MSLELRELMEWEELELDCDGLRGIKIGNVLEEDIDDLVCDSVDEMIVKGLIQHRESVDAAYYIGDAIKKRFSIY